MSDKLVQTLIASTVKLAQLTLPIILGLHYGIDTILSEILRFTRLTRNDCFRHVFIFYFRGFSVCWLGLSVVN